MPSYVDVTDRAAVYAEVQHYYARQIRMLDSADLEGFAATFTEDGVMRHTSRNDNVQGRAAIVKSLRANFAKHDGVVPRHWFDKLLIEPAGDDRVTVSYYALVSLTDADGTVTFLPTCLVDDLLIATENGLLTQSREIHRDDLLLPSATTGTARQGVPG